MSLLEHAYSPERFRSQGHAVVDLLADLLSQSLSGEQSQVVSLTDPTTATADIGLLFDQFAAAPDKNITELFRGIYEHSIRLHHPHYLGHQISPPLPVAALASLMGDLLNNGMGVFEMGVAGTVAERLVIRSLVEKFGFGERSDGFLTSGGTLGNLTALLAARRAKSKVDVWKQGTQGKLALMVSDQAHYCIDKAARVMGWGEAGTILIPTNDRFSMDTSILEDKLATARSDGLEVIAVVGSACSTATGSFDDLRAIGAFCAKHDLWFHVDGAHGAATIYSSEFRERVEGIELADSITMDFHKLLMTPALATALVFKEGKYAAQNFAQKAEYLWADESAQESWHDLARRTFECTKSMFAFKVLTILAMHGEAIFDANVTTLYRSANLFARLIEAESDFELATQPQSNIVCFRYRPAGPGRDLDALNRSLRARLIAVGEFYIVQTVLDQQAWLRCTVANPFTNVDHFQKLLQTIRELARDHEPSA